MPTKHTTAGKRYRALTRLSLRQSPDQSSPLYAQWHVWQAGEVFTPPPHMDVAKALARRIAEEATDG